MIDANSLSLLGFAASGAMIFLSCLSLLDLHVSLGGFRDIAQVLLLGAGGVLSAQGEARLFPQWHEVVQENFGFIYKLQGRGWVYLLAGCYLFGFRAVEVAACGAFGIWCSGIVGFMWTMASVLIMVAGVMSLYVWRAQEAALASLGRTVPDLDFYQAA
jgi:hypothetical protein